MGDVWSELQGSERVQNARSAAEIVYRVLSDEYLRAEAQLDPEDTAERVLSELGVPASVVKSIAHWEHEDTKAKAEMIEAFKAFECGPHLVMEWAENAEELRFKGYVGWAGENEDALIKGVNDVYIDSEHRGSKLAAANAYYQDERGYAQVAIVLGYEDIEPAELEELLEVISGYRKEDMGGVLYEDIQRDEE